jgi:DNA-binding MarR family transcriptional regulator
MHLHDLTGFLIHRTDVKLTNFFIKKLKPFGVTPEQWGVISILDSHRGMTQKELAAFIDKDQTTLVRMIHSMMKKEIVKKQTNIQDRRSQYLFLTEKGEDLKKTLLSIVKDAHQAVTNGLSIEELTQLKTLLDKIYDNVKE